MFLKLTELGIPVTLIKSDLDAEMPVTLFKSNIDLEMPVPLINSNLAAGIPGVYFKRQSKAKELSGALEAHVRPLPPLLHRVRLHRRVLDA